MYIDKRYYNSFTSYCDNHILKSMRDCTIKNGHCTYIALHLENENHLIPFFMINKRCGFISYDMNDKGKKIIKSIKISPSVYDEKCYDSVYYDRKILTEIKSFIGKEL